MAKVFVFLSLFLASVHAGSRQISLTSYIDPLCPSGEPGCPIRNPPRGHNVSLWHCDDSCTIVYMKCHLDHFEITIDSPQGARDIAVYALGAAGHTGGPHSIEECDSLALGPAVPRMEVEPKNNIPVYTPATISFDRCGTLRKPSEDPLSPNNVEHFNELDIVEYLRARNAGQGDPAIYLVSHTRVKVKCCTGGQEVSHVCPEPHTDIQFLSDCDVRDFSLTCSNDVANERYCCEVGLKAGHSLGNPDVGFYVEECHAVDVAGSGETVSLSNGVVPSGGLQVELGTVNPAGGDSTKYTFGGPWVQFDREPADAFEPHKVEVRCTVKLARQSDLASHQPVGGSCSAGAGPAPRSAAGFFQAGSLSLIK